MRLLYNTYTLEKLITLLSSRYDPSIVLHYSTPFELAIAVILSAQCTDKRVNIVTEKFFPRLGTNQIETLATMPREEIEKYIYTTGFYKAKAASIQNLALKLLSDYDGTLPNTMEELVKLPGVGRKTANVLLGELYNKSEGIVVDTHVKRISHRLELAHANSPEAIEKELMKIIPQDKWIVFPHLLIKLGRDVCVARSPKCAQCVLYTICPYANHERN